MLLNLPIFLETPLVPEIPYFLLLDSLDELAGSEKLLQENGFALLLEGVGFMEPGSLQIEVLP